MEVTQSFAIVLRRLRLKTGKSQEDFALEADIDRSYMSRLERGVLQPTISTIFKLSSHLEIAPSELIKLVELELKKSSKSPIRNRIKSKKKTSK